MINLRYLSGMTALLVLVTTGLIVAVMAIAATDDDSIIVAYTDGGGFDYDMHLLDLTRDLSVNITKDGALSMPGAEPVAWLPDGRRFVYVTQRGDVKAVLMRDAITGDIVVIDESTTLKQEIQVTADGEAVIYVADSVADGRVYMRYEIDTGVLAPAENHFGDVSPNGAFVLFGGIINDEGRFIVNVRPVEGSQTLLFDTADAQMSMDADCMQVSRQLFDAVWLPSSDGLILSVGKRLVRLDITNDEIVLGDEYPRIEQIISDVEATDDSSQACITAMSLSPSGRYLALRVGMQHTYLIDLEDTAVPATVFTGPTRNGVISTQQWQVEWFPQTERLLASVLLTAASECTLFVADPVTNAVESLTITGCDSEFVRSAHVPG